MKSSALATAILLVSLCSANAQNSASELKVIYPSTLQGDIVHRSALFGSANFGVHNQEIAKITPLVQGSNSTSTSPCPVELPDSDTASDEVLLLMGWSQCRFVQEAVYAQDLVGAKGLIVVENKCLKSNMVASTTTSAFVEHCKTLCNNGNCAGIDALSYMGGVNHNVHIPSMIISRWDGLRLLECLEQQKSLKPGSLTKLTTGSFITDVNCAVNSHPTDQKVLIDLKWNLPQASKVEYEIWMSSILNADIFTKQLWYENVSPLLEPKTSFTPHMFVYDGSTLGCLSSNGESHCFDACHNGGRYCHYDPDGLGIGRISGADISRENLRQLCLWKILVTDAAESSKSAGEQKWWEYISRFASNCTGEDEDQENPYKESCSKQVHQDMGLDMSKTLACITQSGGYGDNDGANSIMEAELAKRSNMEIIRLPTVIVNGKMIEFGSNLKDILVALCAGFKDSALPEFCPCVESTDVGLYVDAALVETCLQYAPESAKSGDSTSSSASTTSSSNGVSMGTLLFSLIFVVGLLVGGFAFYRKRENARMRAEFHEDVRNIVGEYVRLDADGMAGEAGEARFGNRRSSFRQADESGDEEAPPRRNRDGYQHVVELS